jgi:hypothetical protein
MRCSGDHKQQHGLHPSFQQQQGVHQSHFCKLSAWTKPASASTMQCCLLCSQFYVQDKHQQLLFSNIIHSFLQIAKARCSTLCSSTGVQH